MGHYGPIASRFAEAQGILRSEDLTQSEIEESIRLALDAEDWKAARNYVVRLSEHDPVLAERIALSNLNVCDQKEEWVLIGRPGIIPMPDKATAEFVANKSGGTLSPRRRVIIQSPALFH